MIKRIRDLRNLGSDDAIKSYLDNLCKSRDSESFVEEVVFNPTTQKHHYLIVNSGGFLYNITIINFLNRNDNDFSLQNCLTPFELIKHRINKIHGDGIIFDYTYSLPKVGDVIDLSCKVHGKFKGRLSGIFNGRGCPKCSDKRVRDNNRKDLDFFVKAFRDSHGDRFKYIKLIRSKGKKPKVLIECKIHGQFTQETDAHRLGNGCPKCTSYSKIHTSSGWTLTSWITSSNKSKRFDSFKLYVIECESHDGSELFYKVGRTFTTVYERYHRKRDMPYKYRILITVGSTDPEFIFKLENEIKRDFMPYKYFPKIQFGGMTECFSKKPVVDEYIN